jgi:hypothetical protein
MELPVDTVYPHKSPPHTPLFVSPPSVRSLCEMYTYLLVFVMVGYAQNSNRMHLTLAAACLATVHEAL